jgi:hypothetical protein
MRSGMPDLQIRHRMAITLSTNSHATEYPDGKARQHASCSIYSSTSPDSHDGPSLRKHRAPSLETSNGPSIFPFYRIRLMGAEVCCYS